MGKGFVGTWPILAVLSVIAFSMTACNGKNPDETPTVQDRVVELDLSAGNGCEIAGYRKLIDFAENNDLEVYNETLDEDGADFCSIALIWAAATDGETERRMSVSFGLSIFDTVSEAEDALEVPDRVQLTSPASRHPSDGLEENVSQPWDDGFIWSTPDSYDVGQTEAAARISNIVLWMKFESYSNLDKGQCEGEGGRCGPAPSEVVAWLHDVYLPAIGENVEVLIEK